MWLIKKEIFVTHDLSAFNKILDKLKSSSIKYYTKSVENGGNMRMGGVRITSVRSCNFDQAHNYERLYYIYVKPNDYDEAIMIINS